MILLGNSSAKRDMKAFIDTSDDNSEADIGEISKGKEALSEDGPPKKRLKKTAASSRDTEVGESPAKKPKSIQSVSQPGPSKIQPSVSRDVAMDEVDCFFCMACILLSPLFLSEE